ncbi:MAG: hypothetical protein PWQ25_1719 [Deferribacteres bacterium]|jgi:transcriptional regulator with XRE-family HTH domain|nr:hypothetical protein [Deferribacteres bacterium]
MYNENLLEKYKKEIGENIKFWRKIRGFKQEVLAQMISANKTYLSNIEAGRGSISFNKLSEIAVALDVSIEDLTTPQPYRNIVLELWNDKSIDPPLTEEELKDLLSVRFRAKKPNKQFFLFVLDLMRSGKIFFNGVGNKVLE